MRGVFVTLVSSLSLASAGVAFAHEQGRASAAQMVRMMSDPTALIASVEKQLKKEGSTLLGPDRRETTMRELTKSKATTMYVVQQTDSAGRRMVIRMSMSGAKDFANGAMSLVLMDQVSNPSLDLRQMIDARKVTLKAGDQMAVIQKQMDQAVKGLEDSYARFARATASVEKGQIDGLKGALAALLGAVVPSAQAQDGSGGSTQMQFRSMIAMGLIVVGVIMASGAYAASIIMKKKVPWITWVGYTGYLLLTSGWAIAGYNNYSSGYDY